MVISVLILGGLPLVLILFRFGSLGCKRFKKMSCLAILELVSKIQRNHNRRYITEPWQYSTSGESSITAKKLSDKLPKD